MTKAIARSIEKIVIFNLSGLILFGPYSPLTIKILLYVSATLGLFFRLFQYRFKVFGHLLPATFLDRPLTYFFLALAGSIALSLSPYQSEKIFISRFTGYLFAFFLGAAIIVRNQKNVYPITIALILSGLLVGIGGLRDYFMFSPARLFTSFGSDVNLSMLLSLFIPLIFSLVFYSQNNALRALSGLALLCLMPALLLNYSRAVWISVLLCIMAILILRNRKIVPFLLVALVGGFLLAPGLIKYRLQTTFQQDSRIEMSRTALEIFEDFPVFGAGLGMFEKLRPIYDPEPLNNYIHADNTYTELLAETGLVGMATFLWIFAVFFKKMLRTFNRTEDKNIAAIRMGLTAAVFSCLIVSFGTNGLMVGFKNSIIFWLVLGLAAGLYQGNSGEPRLVK